MCIRDSSCIAAAQNASTAINNLVEGVYVIELQVTDNAGGIGKDSVTIMVNKANSTYLPAVNPANPVNGLDYKYYEGTWDALPNFDALTPLKAGTVAGFDLSLAAKADYFGFSFKGYVQVPADAVYTSVSYTHLDVYKRQCWGRSNCTTATEFSAVEWK